MWLRRRLRGTWIALLVRRVIGGRDSQYAKDHGQSVAYDQQAVAVMRRVLQRDSNYIDVGTHYGDVLSHMIEIAPDGVHDAFEPLPECAKHLREHFPAARVHEIAISDRSEHSEFHVVENDPAYSGLRQRVYDRPDPQIRTIQVPVASLDDMIPENRQVAFIKLDAEGGEFLALKGALNLVRRWRPTIVFAAGLKSSGQYEVTADDLYTLIVDTLKYELSTMGRWLEGRRPYTPEEFRYNWHHGPDWVFLAAPSMTNARA
jgi:FkbM family methyltransferase